jgi:SAM-dependent methyltransferase
MDISPFDQRHYPIVDVEAGYREWSQTYEATVLDLMDLRLLTQLHSLPWQQMTQVADLACGTGRIGTWLKQQGVEAIDGVDLTPEMLHYAAECNVYRHLAHADLSQTGLPAAQYDAVTAVLVDEHLADVRPLYAEAARIARPGGTFVLVGYHPYFLLNGIPTHFDRASGEAITIRCYVHLASDHVRAAHEAGWQLQELVEGLIDAEWVRHKPRWQAYLHRPVSFAWVWRKPDADSSK